MYYTIYKITNIETGKFYIGKHQTENPNDDYFGSGKAIVNAIKLYGKDKFVKEVLYIFSTSKEMDDKEREIITEELVNSPECYNIGIGGEGGPQFKGKTHSAETKAKISASKLGKNFLTKEGLTRILDANKNKVVSDETRKKLSEAAKARKPQDAECKERISLAMKEFHRQKKLCGKSGDQSVS
jgi:group I intron endonuclease